MVFPLIKRKCREWLAWMAPRHCTFCLQQSTQAMCETCQATLIPLPKKICAKCALPFHERCIACAQHPKQFEKIHCRYAFREKICHWIYRFKYHQDLRAGRELSLLLADFLVNQSLRAEIIIPVPLHLTRLRQRGFNQSLEIAKPLSHALHLPIFQGMSRMRETPKQATLKCENRWHNLHEAFKITKPASFKHALIVDDVVTTGATADAMAIALRRAGVQSIEVACLARTEYWNQQA